MSVGRGGAVSKFIGRLAARADARRQRATHLPRKRMLVEALEQRLLLSGGLTATVADIASRLDTSKLQATFGLRLPPWQQGVDRMLAEIL